VFGRKNPIEKNQGGRNNPEEGNPSPFFPAWIYARPFLKSRKF
jgi:hypothetical protein